MNPPSTRPPPPDIAPTLARLPLRPIQKTLDERIVTLARRCELERRLAGLALAPVPNRLDGRVARLPMAPRRRWLIVTGLVLSAAAVVAAVILHHETPAPLPPPTVTRQQPAHPSPTIPVLRCRQDSALIQDLGTVQENGRALRRYQTLYLRTIDVVDPAQPQRPLRMTIPEIGEYRFAVETY